MKELRTCFNPQFIMDMNHYKEVGVMVWAKIILDGYTDFYEQAVTHRQSM